MVKQEKGEKCQNIEDIFEFDLYFSKQFEEKKEVQDSIWCYTSP